MKKVLLITCLFIFGNMAYAQMNNYDFPEDWEGQYAGTMYMYYPTVPRIDTAEVFFEIKEVIADSVWTYVMSYDSKKYGQSTKDYLLVKPNSDQQTVYHLDEQDGILIELRMMANTLYSSFSVMGSYISSRMERIDGGIAFEIFTSQEEATLNSSAPVDPKDFGMDTIKVNSYLPFTVQRVFLQEVDN